jgi:DNA-binding ferritin-like protein
MSSIRPRRSRGYAAQHLHPSAEHKQCKRADMLAELREDNKTLAARLREAHGICEECEDIATASLISLWIPTRTAKSPSKSG